MGMIQHYLLPPLLAVGLVIAGCGGSEQQQAPAEQPQAAPPTQAQPSSQPLVTGLPDFSALVEKEGPAVVNISTVTHRDASDQQQQMEQLPEFFRRFFDEFGGGMPEQEDVRSLGSGFIISSDGYVLTNNHVVADADEIVVRLQDRRELDAELVGADEQSDLALLKVEASDLPVVNIGSSENLKVGEWVLAIGAPFGFDSSVTAGIVSAKGRSLPSDNYVPFIQTDVAINPGNSGGPLFNLNGEVVGINSQIISRSGGYMGLSFAIPMDMAMDVVEQLKDTGKVSRGWLGVLVQEVDRDLAESFGLERPMGALVAQVVEGSPAAAGGLQPGDVIIEFDGHRIERSGDLPKIVGTIKPDSEVALTVMRDGGKKDLSVTVGELPEDPRLAAAGGGGSESAQGGVLGLQVRDASAAELARAKAESGVVVAKVEEGPARAAGVRNGDILVSLNNQPVKDIEALQDIVKSLPEQGTVPALVNRGGNARFIALKLGQ